MLECRKMDVTLIGAFGDGLLSDAGWLSAYLFRGGPGTKTESRVRVELPSGRPLFTVSAGGVTVASTAERVSFESAFSEEAVDGMDDIFVALAEKLPFLRCRALGINFTFSGWDGGARALEGTVFSDAFLGRGGLGSASFSFPDGNRRTANVTVGRGADGAWRDVAFNFDERLPAPPGGDLPVIRVKNAILGGRIRECLGAARRISAALEGRAGE